MIRKIPNSDRAYFSIQSMFTKQYLRVNRENKVYANSQSPVLLFSMKPHGDFFWSPTFLVSLDPCEENSWLDDFSCYCTNCFVGCFVGCFVSCFVSCFIDYFIRIVSYVNGGVEMGECNEPRESLGFYSMLKFERTQGLLN